MKYAKKEKTVKLSIFRGTSAIGLIIEPAKTHHPNERMAIILNEDQAQEIANKFNIIIDELKLIENL